MVVEIGSGKSTYVGVCVLVAGNPIWPKTLYRVVCRSKAHQLPVFPPSQPIPRDCRSGRITLGVSDKRGNDRPIWPTYLSITLSPRYLGPVTHFGGKLSIIAVITYNLRGPYISDG